MKYHVLIKTNETDEIYEFDYDDLEYIKTNIVIPYLKNVEFQFD